MLSEFSYISHNSFNVRKEGSMEFTNDEILNLVDELDKLVDIIDHELLYELHLIREKALNILMALDIPPANMRAEE